MRLPSDGSLTRAKDGRLMISVAPIAVQTKHAAPMLGVSIDTLLAVPFGTLPYRRVGTHRWYLVRLLNEFAERLMAEQIANGIPVLRSNFTGSVEGVSSHG